MLLHQKAVANNLNQII